MIRNMRRGIPNLYKAGTRHIDNAVVQNIEACQSLSTITRTSMGPNGMNKMVINHLERLFVTSDAATIMKELDVDHPAAKMLVMASETQERAIGDGSNFVVVFAGELLKKAEGLLTMGLSATDIVDGYTVALAKAQELLDEIVVEDVKQSDLQDEKALVRGIKSAVASKQYGNEDFLSPLIAKACLSVMPKDPKNFVVGNVRVVKILGGNLQQSEVIRGMVLNRPPKGTVRNVKDAKIAIYTCSLDVEQTETKGTVLLKDAEELLNYSESEEKSIEATIKAISDSGVNVVVVGEAVGEMALHFCNKFGIMVIKLTSKWELRRLCRAVGARMQVKLGPIHADEQGFCKSVTSKEVGDRTAIVFSQEEKDDTGITTVLLRASTNNILNDIERAIDDGVNVVRAMTKDSRFLAGAGASDIELARLLQTWCETREGIEQYAIGAFADALEVVPRTLAENAGQKAMDIISQLYAAHEKGDTNVGVDIDAGSVKDMTKAGVLDLLATKQSAMKLGTDAALTILRVDQIISAKPAGGPKAPGNRGHWDDDD